MSLVSVVIPTHYRNERLGEALDSVLAQRHEPLEVLVVDDSGEDHARPVVESHEGVEYVAHETNQGAHAARATGLEYATGDYVQFLDDDDRLAPGKLGRQIELLEAHDDVGVAYCGFDTEDGKRFLPDTTGPTDYRLDCLRFDNAPCVTSTMLVDAETLEAVRPLDRNSPGADDVRLAIQLAHETLFAAVDEVLVTKGVPADARGASWGAVRGRWDILDAFADRYEAAPDEVRRAAVTNAYLWQGLRCMERRVWSPGAVYAFGQALRHAPRTKLLHVGMLLASLGGAPGWAVGRAVADRVWSGGAHVS